MRYDGFAVFAKDDIPTMCFNPDIFYSLYYIRIIGLHKAWPNLRARPVVLLNPIVNYTEKAGNSDNRLLAAKEADFDDLTGFVQTRPDWESGDNTDCDDPDHDGGCRNVLLGQQPPDQDDQYQGQQVGHELIENVLKFEDCSTDFQGKRGLILDE